MATTAIDPQTSTPRRDGQGGAFGGLETMTPLTDERIDGIARELLAQLSLDEKIGMSGDMSFFRGHVEHEPRRLLAPAADHGGRHPASGHPGSQVLGRAARIPW